MAFGPRIQLGAGASISTRLHPEQNLAVINTEYFVDYLIADVVWSPALFTRIEFGHTSHHLGDNIAALAQAKPIDYSRDYIRAYGGVMSNGSRFYLGFDYGYGFVVGRIVSKKWLLQGGFEYAVTRLGEGLTWYAAADFKFRQELGFGTTQRFQTGIQFRNGSERLFRLALTHQRGLDERGQFHGDPSPGEPSPGKRCYRSCHDRHTCIDFDSRR
jgi:hypothetical protein